MKQSKKKWFSILPPVGSNDFYSLYNFKSNHFILISKVEGAFILTTVKLTQWYFKNRSVQFIKHHAENNFWFIHIASCSSLRFCSQVLQTSAFRWQCNRFVLDMYYGWGPLLLRNSNCNQRWRQKRSHSSGMYFVLFVWNQVFFTQTFFCCFQLHSGYLFGWLLWRWWLQLGSNKKQCRRCNNSDVGCYWFHFNDGSTLCCGNLN